MFRLSRTRNQGRNKVEQQAVVGYVPFVLSALRKTVTTMPRAFVRGVGVPSSSTCARANDKLNFVLFK